MTLKQEDRNALVSVRLQRAKETMTEVHGVIQFGYWRNAANRLYYACYYAVCALLIKNGITAHTHAGVINQFGQYFIAKGIINMEQGKLFKQLFNLRQTGDYDDWIVIKKEDVMPLIEPAAEFIAEIEKLNNKDI
jgi:uncharacterized protein (UPF0332 family)